MILKRYLVKIPQPVLAKLRAKRPDCNFLLFHFQTPFQIPSYLGNCKTFSASDGNSDRKSNTVNIAHSLCPEFYNRLSRVIATIISYFRQEYNSEKKELFDIELDPLICYD